MQKQLILLCLLVFSASFAKAQYGGYMPAYPLEIGIQAGTSQFLGDLGGQSGKSKGFILDTDIQSVRPSLGIFGRYHFSGNFAVRADFNYIQIAGNDEWSDNGLGFDSEVRNKNDAWFRYYRNLNFKSDIFEASVSAEVTPYNFELGSGYRGYSILSPYLHLGVGLFRFNPKGLSPTDGWVDLEPLKTEGQGLVDGVAPYELNQVSIPMGFGLRWSYDDSWSLGLEVSHRLTFTDYLDDVSRDYIDPSVFEANFDTDKARLAKQMARKSTAKDPGLINGVVSAPGEQRGDPKDNDSFYTVTIRFGFYLDTQSMGGGGKRYGCPVW